MTEPTTTNPPAEEAIPADIVAEFRDKIDRAQEEIQKVIVGQRDVIEKILIAIFCRGHALMVGVPGTGKTLLVNTISRVLDLDFSRVQFTPDLLPSDIIGAEILQENAETGKREMAFIQGPVFTNLLLADEINRTPPKTQAALLESMQERRVTYAGKSLKLPAPFFVLATQNPIEQEGTYPLPEAQLDRFFFMLNVGYPDHAEELLVMERFTRSHTADLTPILNGKEIEKYQRLVEKILVRPEIVQYALNLVRATRVAEEYALDECREYLAWGAGPRASLCILLAAKAHALFQGRPFVNTHDIRSVAEAVLCHRLVSNYAAVSEGVTTSHVVRMVLDKIPAPGDN